MRGASLGGHYYVDDSRKCKRLYMIFVYEDHTIISPTSNEKELVPCAEDTILVDWEVSTRERNTFYLFPQSATSS